MVSLIVPVYNSETVITRCVESILGQTYADIEVLLLDDGSTDNSLNICRVFEKQDTRVRVYTHENRGASFTRTWGITLARGEYIQFVDSDDYIAPIMVEKLVEKIQSEDTDLVICGCTEYHPDHEYTILPDIEGKIQVKDLPSAYPSLFEKSILNSPCNKLYKRQYIRSYFPEDLSLGEDLLFNLEYIRQIETIYFLKESLYYYIIRQNSLNRKYRRDSIEIAERLYTENMRFCEEFHMGERAVIHISTIFIKFLSYGLSDLYTVSGYSRQEKRKIAKSWINNRNVQQASQKASMENFQHKAVRFLIQHKQVLLLALLYKMKQNISGLKR